MAVTAHCLTLLVTAANSQYMLATNCNILEYENLHPAVCSFVDSPLCRRCGAEDETSAHILCECEVLTSLRHV